MKEDVFKPLFEFDSGKSQVEEIVEVIDKKYQEQSLQKPKRKILKKILKDK